MQERIAALEGQLGRLRRIGYVSIGLATLCCSSVLIWSWKQTGVYAQTAQSQILKVRGLTIVDEKGTPRAVLGAPLPDPKQGKRPKPVSGLLIYDAAGNERGGYVTSDGENSEAFLTLDNAAGGGQAAMLLANPDEGATFVLTNRNGDTIGMTTAFPRPTLQIAERKKVIFKQPPDVPDVH